MKITNSHIYAGMIALFPICVFLGGIFSYYDEFVSLICTVYCFLALFQGKLSELNKKIVLIMCAITAIGIVSNCMSGLIKLAFPILVDIVWLWKTFATYVFFSESCKNSNIRNKTIRMLASVAKATIVLLLCTALVGQFVDIGVTGRTRILGLKSFHFFWRNGIQTGWLAFCCLIILSLTQIEMRTMKKYFLMALIPLFLTASALVYCWLAVAIILFVLMGEDKQFKVWHIIVIALVALPFAWEELETYFFSTESPARRTLLEHGAIVANRYFPLGSGFATYGSEMAQRYYSKLYVDFGWEYTWLFGRESSFLNDNFFAGILGQFGWGGFFLYLGALFTMLKANNSPLIPKRVRVVLVATIITIFAVMVGSASAKSMMGVCTFAVLGLGQSTIISQTNVLQNTREREVRNDYRNSAGI